MIDARPITLRSAAEIAAMREAGRIVGEVHEMIRREAQPGVTTAQLDVWAEEIIRSRGATPSFKGYSPPGRKPFPATLCTSVDDAIVHGIPDGKPLREGQILSVDVGAILADYHGDAALTVPIGEVSAEAERLMRVTEESLQHGIEQMRAGNRVSDIGAASTSPRRGRRLQRGAGLRRPRHRQADARGPRDTKLRAPQLRATHPQRHGFRHRTDGQRRRLADARARRRLDSRDRRRKPQCSL